MAEKVKNAAQASLPVNPTGAQQEVARIESESRAPAANGKGRKKGSNPALVNESKAERFRRLANKRVPKVLRMLAHIENLTRAASYEYTPEQADKIVAVLALAMKRIADGFKGEASKQGGFSLYVCLYRP